MPKLPKLNLDPSKTAQYKVIIESGCNNKQLATPNQDLAEWHLLDQTIKLTKAEIQTLLTKAFKATNKKLQTYITSGTTFTVCAVGDFNDENEKAGLTAVCAHVGDSGALAVNTQGIITRLSRPHYVESTREQKRIVDANLTGNIVACDSQIYLASGYNYFKYKKFPISLGTQHLNSFIFVEKSPYETSELYYITAMGIAEHLIIINYIKLKETTDSKDYEIHLPLSKEQPSYRFPDFIIQKILKCCEPYHFPHPLYLYETPPENKDSKSTPIDVLIIANVRALGNTIFQTKGMIPTPEFKDVAIQPDTTLILYTNGITQVLTLEQMVQMRRVSIAKVASARGATDDHTVIIATGLDQIPKGKILFLIMADGDGVLGHVVAKQAMEFFINYLHTRLAPKPVAATPVTEADHKADAKKYSIPVLNLKAITEKKPATVPTTAAGVASKTGFAQASVDAPLLQRNHVHSHKPK